MKIFEIMGRSHIPENARYLHEDEFYQFIQSMLDNSNFGPAQKEEFLEDFNETQRGLDYEEMAEKINRVFHKWHFPYKVDHISHEEGYEPLYLMRKLK